MFCHKCGAQIAEEADFCHKCGTKVIYGDVELNNTGVANESGKKLHKIIISVLLLIVLLVAILSGAFQNIFDKLIDINREIENQATGATTVPGIQSATDLFPTYGANESPSDSSESSFAWVEEPYMVTEDDIFQTRYIAGAIQNISDITFASASVQFVLYDSAGNQIDTAFDVIDNFIAGNTWRFKAIVLSDDVTYFEFLHATKTYP